MNGISGIVKRVNINIWKMSFVVGVVVAAIFCGTLVRAEAGSLANAEIKFKGVSFCGQLAEPDEAGVYHLPEYVENGKVGPYNCVPKVHFDLDGVDNVESIRAHWWVTSIFKDGTTKDGTDSMSKLKYQKNYSDVSQYSVGPYSLDPAAEYYTINYDIYEANGADSYDRVGEPLAGAEVRVYNDAFRGDVVPSVEILSVKQRGQEIEPSCSEEPDYCYYKLQYADAEVEVIGSNIPDNMSWTYYSGFGGGSVKVSKAEMETGYKLMMAANYGGLQLNAVNYLVFGSYLKPRKDGNETSFQSANMEERVPDYDVVIRHKNSGEVISTTNRSSGGSGSWYVDPNQYDKMTNPLELYIKGSGYDETLSYGFCRRLYFGNTEIDGVCGDAGGREINEGFTVTLNFDPEIMTFDRLFDGTFREVAYDMVTTINSVTKNTGFSFGYGDHRVLEAEFYSTAALPMISYLAAGRGVGGELIIENSFSEIYSNFFDANDEAYLYLNAEGNSDGMRYYVYYYEQANGMGYSFDDNSMMLRGAELIKNGVLSSGALIPVKISNHNHYHKPTYTVVVEKDGIIVGIWNSGLYIHDAEVENPVYDETRVADAELAERIMADIRAREAEPAAFQAKLEAPETFEAEFDTYLVLDGYRNLDSGCGGICGVVGKLQYDADKIELVGVEALEGYEMEQGESIVLSRPTSVTEGTKILKAHFKNLGLASGDTTTVRFVNIEGSDGDQTITSDDASATVKFVVPVRYVNSTVFLDGERQIFARAGTKGENGAGLIFPINAELAGAIKSIKMYYDGYGFDDETEYRYVVKYQPSSGVDWNETKTGVVNGAKLNRGELMVDVSFKGGSEPTYMIEIMVGDTMVYWHSNTFRNVTEADLIAVPEYGYSVSHAVNGAYSVTSGKNQKVKLYGVGLESDKKYVVTYAFNDYARRDEVEKNGSAQYEYAEQKGDKISGTINDVSGAELMDGFTIMLPDSNMEAGWRVGDVTIKASETSYAAEAFREVVMKFVDAGEIVNELGGYNVGENMVLGGITHSSKVSNVLGRLGVAEGFALMAVNKDGGVIAGETLMGTGAKIFVQDNNGQTLMEYVAKVKGDSSGDGKITVLDLVQAKRDLAGLTKLGGVFSEAADVTGTGKISITDVVKICRHVAGLEEIR